VSYSENVRREHAGDETKNHYFRHNEVNGIKICKNNFVMFFSNYIYSTNLLFSKTTTGNRIDFGYTLILSLLIL
jgi:hypothetical protein